MLGDSMYLENIREYVEDHKLIVTYKWLSRELDVPANAAKQMLYSYKQQDPSVTVTYLISGLVGSSEPTDHEVHVVKEAELEKTKEKFHTVLGLHIFSVQNVELKNADSLFAASYDACTSSLDKYSKWSPIDCPVETTPRPVSALPPATETTPHPVKMPPVTELPKKTPTPAPSFPPHAQQSRDKKLKAASSQASVKAAAKKVPSKKPNKPFFPITEKKVEKDKTPVVKEENKLAEPKQEPVSVAPKKTDVTPVASSPEDSAQSSDERQESMKHSKLQFLENSDIDDGGSDEEPVTKQKAASNGQVKKTKPNGVKGEATVLGEGKKRRRVQELSSDEEKPVEETPQEPTTKRRRKRVKKLVPKMYINEDGEMVTERVWETDSASASSEGEGVAGEGVARESIEPTTGSDAVLSSPSPAKPPVRQGKKKQASLFMFAKKT